MYTIFCGNIKNVFDEAGGANGAQLVNPPYIHYLQINNDSQRFALSLGNAKILVYSFDSSHPLELNAHSSVVSSLFDILFNILLLKSSLNG